MLHVRIVSPNEVHELQQISIATFRDAFGAVNRTEDMDHYIAERLSIKSLTDQLHEESEFYFLEYQKQIIGYLKLNFGASQTEIKDCHSMEIERIYMARDHQGKGHGALLINKALKRGVDKALDFVWLGVWEHNTDAIRFYQRLGFEMFDKHTFMLGQDRQTDIMMRKDLDKPTQ